MTTIDNVVKHVSRQDSSNRGGGTCIIDNFTSTVKPPVVTYYVHVHIWTHVWVRVHVWAHLQHQ